VREIFTHGSVGRAPGNWCLYPDETTARQQHSQVNIRQNKVSLESDSLDRNFAGRILIPKTKYGC